MKKTPVLTILIGCPASGKSTYSEWIVKTEPKTMRVSRDEIRATQFATVMEQDAESMISKLVNEQVKTLLQNGWSVLLDNCNTKLEYIETHIKQFQDLAHIEFRLFDLPIDELLIRNSKRTRKVPKKVIEKMFQQLQNLKTKFDFQSIRKTKTTVKYSTQNLDLPKAIICDLDGTLALMNGRNPFDASRCDEDVLNNPVANVLINYKNLGYKIILLSGREDKFEVPTLKFLANNSIEFDVLLMRKTADNRKDSIVKKEIFDAEIRDKYLVEFVLDDRNQVVAMWRKELKLPCFQVYYGDF